MRTRLIDRVGPDPVLHSWGYADAVLRDVYPHAPDPTAPFWYREPGLWLPLSCAYAQVQVAKANTTAVANTTATAAINTTSGNMLFVQVRTGNTDGTITNSVDDGGTNTFTSIGRINLAAGGNLEAFYAKNITGVNNAITLTMSGAGANYSWIYVVEGSGLNTAAPLDTHVKNTTAGVSDMTSSNLTTADTVEVVFGGATQNGLRTYSAGANYTLLDGNIGGYGGVEYRVTAAALAAEAQHITASGTENGAVEFSAFKLAAAAGLAIPVVLSRFRRRWQNN